MAGVQIANASTISIATDGTFSYHLPFFSTMSINNSGALVNAVGYTGTAGNAYKQTLGTFQVDPETLELQYTINGILEKTAFEWVTNQYFSPTTTTEWYPSVKKIIATNKVTDTRLVGVSVAKVGVLMQTATGATVRFEKITTGSPTAAQVKVDTTLGELTFHADNNGKEIQYTFPASDSVNLQGIGIPGTTRKQIDSFQSVFTLGIVTGFVRGIVPKAIASTSYSLGGGQQTDVTKTAQAVLVPGFSNAIGYQWLENVAGAEI